MSNIAEKVMKRLLFDRKSVIMVNVLVLTFTHKAGRQLLFIELSKEYK